MVFNLSDYTKKRYNPFHIIPAESIHYLITTYAGISNVALSSMASSFTGKYRKMINDRSFDFTADCVLLDNCSGLALPKLGIST